MKHVAACSFGKDSIATVILAREHNEPLDEVIYCEVMFDEEISGEVPEHRQFIYEVAKPLFESWGIKVTILRSEKTYIFVDDAQFNATANCRRLKGTSESLATTLFNI